ncbi:hypothetical protein EMIHUDRAFT_228830 [Emiliania huxleyi CCMP1516]|uniref:Uncharacterized protein n=2 Tax=Emiliania huxleyi TaxID=2903 RepID=A0A0D3KE17_EMIH1|nr:hypothetical protein EMIHUDRAFT_228830 [Emiliania huxleyi CCMP1516]EOD34002.1 hypothetical protein EMIHUDRAFT_228830 [Emiliania huxleyi CCMP1516]|eukprot:XP_005786431.1 hypothetical protein EMIHUDRAFT_228830 [Emiliania huxleyi CCMP1516]
MALRLLAVRTSLTSETVKSEHTGKPATSGLQRARSASDTKASMLSEMQKLSEFILLMSMEATYSAVEKAAAASLALSEPATRFMIEKTRSLAVQWRDRAASTFQQEQDSQVCALLSSVAYCDDVQPPPMLSPKLATLASVLAAPKTVDIEASDAELREYEARLDRLREKRRASEQRTAERKAGMLPAREPEAEAASLECYLREREEREKLRALKQLPGEPLDDYIAAFRAAQS